MHPSPSRPHCIHLHSALRVTSCRPASFRLSVRLSRSNSGDSKTEHRIHRSKFDERLPTWGVTARTILRSRGWTSKVTGAKIWTSFWRTSSRKKKTICDFTVLRLGLAVTTPAGTLLRPAGAQTASAGIPHHQLWNIGHVPPPPLEACACTPICQFLFTYLHIFIEHRTFSTCCCSHFTFPVYYIYV